MTNNNENEYQWCWVINDNTLEPQKVEGLIRVEDSGWAVYDVFELKDSKNYYLLWDETYKGILEKEIKNIKDSITLEKFLYLDYTSREDLLEEEIAKETKLFEEIIGPLNKKLHHFMSLLPT